MTPRRRTGLPFSAWPPDLQARWQAAFEPAELFDEPGPGAHLASRTRDSLRYSLGYFLWFLGRQKEVGNFAAAQLTKESIAAYVEYCQQSCSDRSVASELLHLRQALLLLCGTQDDLGWLKSGANRIRVRSAPRPRRHGLVMSDRLYLLGLKLMNEAQDAAAVAGTVSKSTAFKFRDGLMIALLAAIPLRRRTIAALQIGKQLAPSGKLWALDILPKDTKTKRALEYSIPPALCEKINLYLERFRPTIPGARDHQGLWASNKGHPMDDGAIYEAIVRRTRNEFGFGVNLHRFRHGAATFLSIHDPENVLCAKDLLGHASFSTTEQHYIAAQSRVAGRRLANALTESLKSRF